MSIFANELRRHNGASHMMAVQILADDFDIDASHLDVIYVNATVDDDFTINDGQRPNEIGIVLPNDLVLVNLEADEYRTVTGQARWLGAITESVRLHSNPFEWLAAGGTGVCSLPPCYRGHMKDLQAAKFIVCADIHTAMNAWDWGFAADPDELVRFTVDATPADIQSYHDQNAFFRGCVRTSA